MTFVSVTSEFILVTVTTWITNNVHEIVIFFITLYMDWWSFTKQVTVRLCWFENDLMILSPADSFLFISPSFEILHYITLCIFSWCFYSKWLKCISTNVDTIPTIWHSIYKYINRCVFSLRLSFCCPYLSLGFLWQFVWHFLCPGYPGLDRSVNSLYLNQINGWYFQCVLDYPQ